MKTMTRGKLFAVASAGAAGVLTSSAESARLDIPLDAVYERVQEPKIVVAYPSRWHLYPRLITDLTAPIELFSVSNRELTPGPSFDESGFPDVSRLGARDVLITMWAQYLGTDPRKYSPGPPVSGGITLAGLTQDTLAFPAVEQRVASYLSPTIGYLVHVWSGKNADLSVPDAILRSFRPL
jgi:hypothetical protein